MIGGCAAALGPPYYGDPKTIVTSRSFRFACRADRGVTIATGVSAWADYSGAGNHFSQVVGSSQPTFSANGGPNGTPTIIGDGVDDILNSTWDPALASVSPVFIWAITKPITVAVGGRPIAGGATAMALTQLTPGTLRLTNGTNGPSNTNHIAGVTKRLIATFTSSTADRLTIGSVTVTGTDTGNTDPAGFAIFGRFGGGGVLANVEIGEIFVLDGEPTAAELAALDRYAAARYGASVIA